MSTLADWVRIPEAEEAVAQHSRVEAKTSRLSWSWVVGIVATVLYVAGGLWMVAHYGIIGDAVSRVGNAYYVLFSRDPHLEAIGFVWNPLPSLLALPLVALKDLWPALVRDGVAAILISATAGGISIVYMRRIVRRFGLPNWMAWTTALLFGLNPFIAFYSANGMTEVMMIATLLGALDGVLDHLKTRRLTSLVTSAIWVSAGFLIRYEVAFWAMIIAGVLMIGFARLPAYEVVSQRYRGRISGRLILWLSPLAWVSMTWVFANWIIMKDPLYFLHSTYSNTVQMETGAYTYATVDRAVHSLAWTAWFVGAQLLLFAPVYLGIAGLIYLACSGKRVHQLRAQVLLAATLAVPFMQAVMLYQGASAGWLRYFVLVIPFGFLSLCLVSNHLRRFASTRIVLGGCLLLLVLGNLGTYGVMTSTSDTFRPDRMSTFEETDDVVEYLDNHPDGLVLVDSFRGYWIILRAENPERFAISSDRDFRELLEQPQGEVDAFLVPNPKGLGGLDAVNREYPGLWEGNVPWATLVKEFPGPDQWRLYSVGSAATTQPSEADSSN